MQWAARESRCPLCKQRFTTVTTANNVLAVKRVDQTYEWDGVVTADDVEDVEGIVCNLCDSGAQRQSSRSNPSAASFAPCSASV